MQLFQLQPSKAVERHASIQFQMLILQSSDSKLETVYNTNWNKNNIIWRQQLNEIKEINGDPKDFRCQL